MSPRTKWTIDTVWNWFQTTRGRLLIIISVGGFIISSIVYIGDQAIKRNDAREKADTLFNNVAFIKKNARQWTIDVTSIQLSLEYVQKEQAIINATQKLILDKIGYAYFRTDKYGYTTELSRGMLVLTGRTFDELKGIGWTSFIVVNPHRQLSSKLDVLKNFDESIRRGVDFYDGFSMIKPDSSIVNLKAEAREVTFQGQRIAFVGCLQKL